MKHKQILAMLLSLVMVFTLIPVTACAAEETPLFSWGFEADEPATTQWTALDLNADGNTWQLYNPAEHPGDNYDNDNGTVSMRIFHSIYQNESQTTWSLNDALVSPMLVLPQDKECLTLRWDLLADLEEMHNSFDVLIYTGETPVTAETIGQAELLTNFVITPNVKLESCLDLTAYAGKSVQLIFLAGSDISVDTIAIDNVTIDDRPVENYTLFVGNQPVTAENQNELVRGGTMRFDQENKTLYLTDAVIFGRGSMAFYDSADSKEYWTGCFPGIATMDDLTIVLEGRNMIITESRSENSKPWDSAAIFGGKTRDSEGVELTIRGDGQLTLYTNWVGSGNVTDGFGILVWGNLTVEDHARLVVGMAPAMGNDALGIECDELLLKDHADVRAVAATSLDDDSRAIDARQLILTDHAKLYAESGTAKDDSCAVNVGWVQMRDDTCLEAVFGNGVDDGEGISAAEVELSGNARVKIRGKASQDNNTGISGESLALYDNAGADIQVPGGQTSVGVSVMELAMDGNAFLDVRSDNLDLRSIGDSYLADNSSQFASIGVSTYEIRMIGGRIRTSCGKILGETSYPVLCTAIQNVEFADPTHRMAGLLSENREGTDLQKFDLYAGEFPRAPYMEIHACEHDSFCPTEHLTDNPADAWFHASVDYAVEKGYMVGTSADKFSPNEAATRQQLVTVLWRRSGSPEPAGEAEFTDLADEYSRKAIAWAVENGLTQGTSETTFSPRRPVSRQDFATFLYRYAQLEGKFTSYMEPEDTFADWDEIDDYAVEAIKWAMCNWIILGTPDGKLKPKDSATRAEMAAFLLRYDNIIELP